MAAPARYLIQARRPSDVSIGWKDSENWAWLERAGVVGAWQSYGETVAPHAQAIVLHLLPNRTRMAPSDAPDVRSVQGRDDTVLG